MSVISVEISRPGRFGAATSATLAMPATWAEFQDVKEKARITHERSVYSYKILRCEYDWLKPHIPANGNLLELNLLASRIQNHIQDRLDVFEAMVDIETQRGGGKPIPLPRLINLTFSLDNCHVAGNIRNDAELGNFLYENDFLHEADETAVLERIGKSRPFNDLCAMLGKEHRESEGGVITGSGKYIEFDGTVNEMYFPSKIPYFDHPEAPVVMENAVCTDCLIPAAKEWINAAGDRDMVNEFSQALEYMERQGGLTEYKALLETARCDSLEEALRLTEGIEEYQLTAECPGPEAYARDALSKPPFSELGVDFSKYVKLYAFGMDLMARNNIVETSYGLLSRKDGGPIFTQTAISGLSVDSELMLEDDHVNAYLPVWFDVNKRLGLNTEGTDEYVNLYADYYPADDRLDVTFVHRGPDAELINEKPLEDITPDEKRQILRCMKEAGLDQCVAQMAEEQSAAMNMGMG